MKKFSHVCRTDYHDIHLYHTIQDKRVPILLYHDTHLDEDNQILYTFHQEGGNLVEINLRTNQYKTLSIKHFGYTPSIVNTRQYIHVIGGLFGRTNHYIVNKRNKKIYEMRKFPKHESTSHRMIHLKKRDVLLMVGVNHKSEIWQFSFKRQNGDRSKWIKWELPNSPQHLKHAAVVSTKDERYLIFLGGVRLNKYLANYISIYDFEKNEFRRSAIECPIKSAFEAKIIDKSSDNELLVDGFGRKFAGNDGKMLPRCLVMMIANYVSREVIHIFETNIFRLGHWNKEINNPLRHFKIDVDAILSS